MRKMNYYSAFGMFNKCLTSVPLVLLLGADGGRGDESLIALSASIFLAVTLTWIEGRVFAETSLRPVMVAAFTCVALSIVAFGIELMAIASMGKLAGPIRIYGIPVVISCLVVVFVPLGLICAWNDYRVKRTKLHPEQHL